MGLGEKMKKWLLIIFGLVGLDQLTKYLVVKNIVHNDQSTFIEVIDGFFSISHVRNPGSAFGMFEGIAESYIIFLIFIAIAIGLFGYMFYKSNPNDKKLVWYNLALTLIIAGAIGNGIDRIFQFDHKVVDFINFYGVWEYVFNVADMCLNVGIGLFIFDQFILEPKRAKAAKEQKALKEEVINE